MENTDGRGMEVEEIAILGRLVVLFAPKCHRGSQGWTFHTKNRNHHFKDIILQRGFDRGLYLARNEVMILIGCHIVLKW